MSRISLVVSDVDGTLVTTDKRLTPRAVAAVARLHQAGIGFSICSSRPPFGLRALIETLQLTLPLGGYNAGAIVTPDLGIVEQETIPVDAARDAVAAFRAHGVDCWLFTGDTWLVANPQGDHVAHEWRTVGTPPTVVPAFVDAHFTDLGKIVGASCDHPLISRVTDDLCRVLDDRAVVRRSQAYYCDVMAPGVNKGRLVALLSRRLGVPRAEIMVLGDMENDIPMMAEAGLAVAMGNAADPVKRAAQATTLSNDEDGFAIAIERHVFGD